MDPNERIKLLSENGNCVEVDANIPLRMYFRSGTEMVKMAKIYEEEGNLESAFILYIRFITLFIERLRTHPNYGQYTPADKKNINQKVNDVFPKAERIKALLRERYTREHEEIVAQQRAIEERLRDEKRKKEQQEFNERRELEMTAEPKSKWDNIQITNDTSWPVEDNFRDLVYPTDNLSNQEGRGTGVKRKAEERIIPIEILDEKVPSSIVPSRDLKPVPSTSSPHVNRDTKPQSLLSANFDQKSGKLRTLLIPEEVMDKFLSLAFDNTSRNVETCGILAGKLSLNKFVITHIIIPQQVGTADSCNTLHEEELFAYQDSLDAITLGWIHTHPSQTAFLSSVDLHTHCSYQLMMPEAVAIVCAPKFNETGFFTLTPNHGLQFIANCRKDGFHPHPNEPPLFETAPHIQLDPSIRVQVVDLRS